MAHDFDEPLIAEPRVLFSRVLELMYAANLVPSTEPNLVNFDEDWKRRQRAELGVGAKDYLSFAAGRVAWATLSLCDYLPATGLYNDWDPFADFVAKQPIDEFLNVMFNNDIPQDEIPRLRKEPRRVLDWMDRLTCYSKMEAEAAIEIYADPEGFRERMLTFVDANQTVAFEDKLAELRPRIEGRMNAVRERLRGRDPIAVAEELAKKTFKYSRDFLTYTFAPSYFIGRKHLYVWGRRNFLMAFSLSQAEERLTETAKELSERMRVLGDRTRLDILRLLSEGPSYGKAIAERLELTTATVSRQLDQLKEAGLVVEDRPDASNVKLIRLRAEALNELFGQVGGFLGVPKL